MFAIFGVVEYVLKSDLTNTAKTLLYNYYKSSDQPTYALRAREAVFRYAQCRSLPRLADIRQKSRAQLDRLEHLVLRMEYEAARLDGSWPPADEPEVPPGAAPETASFAGSPLSVPAEETSSSPPEETPPPMETAAAEEEMRTPRPRFTEITPPRVLGAAHQQTTPPARQKKSPVRRKSTSGARPKTSAKGKAVQPQRTTSKPAKKKPVKRAAKPSSGKKTSASRNKKPAVKKPRRAALRRKSPPTRNAAKKTASAKTKKAASPKQRKK